MSQIFLAVMTLFLNNKLFLYLNIAHIITVVISQNYEAFDDSALFRMQWRGKPKIFMDNPEYEKIVMKSTNNEDFDCFIPFSHNPSKEEEEKYIGPSSDILLMPLFKKKSCATRIDTYWIYELCHGRYIRQYHEERDNSGWAPQQYILGVTSLENIEEIEQIKNDANLPETLIDGVRTPYFAVDYTDGTKCDLTGQPRRTRVLYVCHEDGRHSIARIKEIVTCVYEITVLTSHLCSHPAYKPQDPTQANLHCISREQNVHRPKRLLDLEVESQKLRTQSADVTSPLGGISIQLKFRDDDGNDEYEVVDENSKSSWVSRRIEFPEHTSLDQKLTSQLLSGEHCLEGGAGWWKYEFCYGKSVRQYHKYSDGSKISVLLGTFDLLKHNNWIFENNSRKFKQGRSSISHFYSDGDYCGEAARKRQTEVRLKCIIATSPNSVTLYLMEPRLCEYVLYVESPLVCRLMETANDYGLQSSDLEKGREEIGNGKVETKTDEFIEN